MQRLINLLFLSLRLMSGVLALCALFGLAGSVSAVAGTWVYVGSAGFSGVNVHNPAFAFDSNGTPYVAFRYSFPGSNGPLTVKKFDGANWVNVGSAGFSGSNVDIVTIAIDGTVPYVAYRSTSDYHAKVMKFESGSWTDLYSSGLPGQFVGSLSLVVDAGTPYLAYAGSSTPYVMKFDSNTNTWTDLGAGTIVSSYADYTSLVIYNHTPYLAFFDGDHSNSLTVKKFESGTWSPVGAEGFSSQFPGFISLALDGSGTPYVAFQDGSNGAKATVMKFDGTNWGMVGSGVVSTGIASLISLNIDSGRPYVAFQDGDNGSKATVMRFDGTSWSALGGVGFTDNVAQEPSLKFYAHTPYIVFWQNNYPYHGAVMKYDLSPTVTAFAATSVSGHSDLQWFDIPITSFTASGNGPLGYLITDSATPPSVGAPGWSDLAPTTYRVPAVGTYTLYPWVKDAANLVSGVYGTPATVQVTASAITVGSNADSGAGSLREAISHTTPGGAITFDNNYHINLNSPLTVDRDLMIDGSNHTVVLDGQYNTGVMEINTGTTVTLDTLTIQNGESSLDCGSGDTCGGGILNSGILTVKNSILSGNYADIGGAIANLQGASLAVTGSTFSNNLASNSGGAIYNLNGTVDVADSTLDANTSGFDGGALFNDAGATLNISQSTLSNNTATNGNGGAILNSTGSFGSIIASVVKNNTATNGNGGAIQNSTGSFGSIIASTLSANQAAQGNGGGINNEGVLKVRSSTLTSNTAMNGGAIMQQGSNDETSSITNTTLQGNTATQNGGAINVGPLGPPTQVFNATLSGNGGLLGGGIYLSPPGPPDPMGSFVLRNTIISDSPSGGDCVTLVGPVDARNNLIQSTGTDACNLTDGANGNLIGREPRLTPLADYGGPTQTHKLENDSPAIDAGDQTTCDDVNRVNKLDQRSKARDDLRCDIGGFELTGDDSNTVQLTPATGIMRTFGPVRAGIQSDGTSPGTVNIVREPLTGGLNALPRQLSITAPTDTGLNLTLQMCYSSAELGSLNENNLRFFSKTGTGPWTDQGAPTFSGASPNRCASRSGITHLSEWTLASAAPTATDAVRARGGVNSKGNALVRWKSVNELQIVGYNVYRMTRSRQGQGDKAAWKQINVNLIQAKHPGTAQSAGYRFADKKVKGGKTYRYKIQVLYADNHITWTNVVRVKTP